jgi:formate dehydrogenase
MAVNIDEGEPGTFKDRYYLERDPHRFLEGMLIAAQLAGTERCYIYLRDEYHALRRMLQRELAALEADPPCPLPHIELRRGAGAYVCGEESAMIESIEGKRGQPRLRPPYIAQAGLFGRPTLEHNLETLHWVRDILEKGPTWFTGFGRHGRTGLRSFSVSGRVRQPGVKLAPAGITLRELIDEYCGGMQWPLPKPGRLPAGWKFPAAPAAAGSSCRGGFDTRNPAVSHGSVAVPRWHRQGGATDAGPGMGLADSPGPQRRDGGCLHLRPGAGRTQPLALRAAVLCARDRALGWTLSTSRSTARRRRPSGAKPS